MTDVWSQRADAFRESPTHREGPDLDLLVEWCEPGPDVKVLDVATGGGHVARRLRDEGCTVVTVDPAPGMQPDVISLAEELPFEDGSFDVVTCRIAAHHFEDIRKAVGQMARVAQRLVVIEDNVFVDERVEHFERHPVVEDWLARVETPPAEAERVRELLEGHVRDGVLELKSIVVKARRSQK